MAKKNKTSTLINLERTTIDCACLIHDTLYSWDYVDRLYNALKRNLTLEVKMHVYTEKQRVVPPPYIHHPLEEWTGIKGPKKSWWYKIQLFNPRHHRGPLLYFDLDTVVCGNIDWMWRLPTDRFWAVKDFKYLFKNNKNNINSSVMWFDPAQWSHVYQEFDPSEVVKTRRWHGDQDYIQEKIPEGRYGLFDSQRVRSWRWESLDGGYDFKMRKHKNPGSGTTIDPDTSVLIFHGNPKPHEIQDPNVLQHWS